METTHQALEFLVNNCELRSFFQYFVDRPDCAGIRWEVKAGTVVNADQVIGKLVFVTGAPVEIVAPVDGVLLRTYDPNVDDLPYRPSQPIALFLPAPPAAPPGG